MCSLNDDPLACFVHEELEEAEIAVDEVDVEKNDLYDYFEPCEEAENVVDSDSYGSVYEDSDEGTCNAIERLQPKDSQCHDQQPSTSKAATVPRKGTRNPELWKRNVRSALCQRGLPYIDQNGIARLGKTVGPACSNSCHLKCRKKIPPEERQEIHEYFWSLDKEERNAFYDNFVKKVPIKRRRVPINNENNAIKKASYQYFLKLDDRTIQVCQKYFLNTLSISTKVLRNFFSKRYEKDTIESVLKPLNCSKTKTQTKKEMKIKEVKSVLETKYAVEEIDVEETNSFEICLGDNNEDTCDMFANSSPQSLEEPNNTIEEIDNSKNNLYEIVNDDDEEGSCDLFANLSSESHGETINSVHAVEWLVPDDSEYQDQHLSTTKTSTTKKKRKRNPELWKRNIRSALCQRGLPYIDQKGIPRPGKIVGPACGDSCYHNCTKKITSEQRNEIHGYFWSLGKEERNVFYTNFVKKVPIKRRKVRVINKNPVKKASYQYFLKPDDRTIQVCQKYFLNTLSITTKVLRNFFLKHYEKDTTESVFLPSNFEKIGPTTKNERNKEVVSHIKSFPVLDSHYCSNSTNRQYLDCSLNINKMYSLYLQKTQYPVSLKTYRNVFNAKFNYSFNIPNKDLCDKCTVHKTQKSAGEAIVFEKHLAEIELTKSELNADLKNINSNNAVLLYDMQNVYSLPKIWASNYFYKRKLCVYNLTGTLVLPGLKVTYCAIWNESNSGRSENDIASALTRILDEVVNDFPKIIGLTLWSDLCVPQNKNQMTASAMLQFLYDNPSIQYINQKFSEPGHNSVQEVDSVQSAIEKYLKEMEIPSQATLIRYLRNAKLTKVYLRVLELGLDDFKSFECKSEKLNFSSIPFAECKSLIFKQNDLFKIGRKLSFQDKSYVFYSLKKKTTRFYIANKLWDEPMQLSGKKQICRQKIADLKSMLPIITDKADKDFYHNILNE